jgi:hypothetical protein
MKYDVLKRIQIRDINTREVHFYSPGTVVDMEKDAVLEREGFVRPHSEKPRAGSGSGSKKGPNKGSKKNQK